MLLWRALRPIRLQRHEAGKDRGRTAAAGVLILCSSPAGERRHGRSRPYTEGVLERKLATVLFVDLVGSTAFTSQDDPEVVRRRVDAYFDSTARCIEQHGGTVEKFAGDAVMAAFGIPRAHEDDADRALRAALAILESVRGLGLEARIGVEAGEVLAGEGTQTFATGPAVNVAARLEQAAAPNEILVGRGARGLAGPSIELEDA